MGTSDLSIETAMMMILCEHCTYEYLLLLVQYYGRSQKQMNRSVAVTASIKSKDVLYHQGVRACVR